MFAGACREDHVSDVSVGLSAGTAGRGRAAGGLRRVQLGLQPRPGRLHRLQVQGELRCRQVIPTTSLNFFVDLFVHLLNLRR